MSKIHPSLRLFCLFKESIPCKHEFGGNVMDWEMAGCRFFQNGL